MTLLFANDVTPPTPTSRGVVRPGGSHARETVGPASSDAEIVRSVLDGDRDSFRWIVERYQSRVYTSIFRIVHHAEDAEDLAQETFVRAYRALGRYDPERPFAAWLLTIATRLSLNTVRRKEPQRVSLDQPIDAGETSEALTLMDVIRADAESASEAAATAELQARIEEATDRLPSSMRAVFNLRYQEDLPLAEIGKITGMSLTAVKVALHRARRFLREWVNP